MPITRIARGPVLATPWCNVAMTPCEMTPNEKGSALVCPAGAGSSDEKTPNLIQVNTTPRVSAMSLAVRITMARTA